MERLLIPLFSAPDGFASALSPATVISEDGQCEGGDGHEWRAADPRQNAAFSGSIKTRFGSARFPKTTWKPMSAAKTESRERRHLERMQG